MKLTESSTGFSSWGIVQVTDSTRITEGKSAPPSGRAETLSLKDPSVPSRRRKTLPALFQAGLLAFHHQRERGVARRHLKPIGRGVRRDLLQREPHADGLAAHFALCVPGPRVALHGPSGAVVLTEVI